MSSLRLTDVDTSNYIIVIGVEVQHFFVYIIILNQSNSFTVLLFSLFI